MSKSVMLAAAALSLTALAGPSIAPAQPNLATETGSQKICVCNETGCSCVLVEVQADGDRVY